MVTERTIINALIIGASFIIAPFLISSTLSFDYLPTLVFGGLLALLWAFFFLKETLCIWPLIGGSVAGSLNFLPLPLNATQVFCILLILYYMTGYVIIRQKRIKLGKTKFLWPILTVTLVLLYHNHSLNLAVLGGDTEGAKPAYLSYLVVLAYFCGINLSNPSVRFLSKVPLYCVIAMVISTIPYVLSTYIPSLAPLLYSVTDSVNVSAYMATQTPITASSDADSAIGRLLALGPLGGTLQLYLLCRYPIGTWLRPSRWWVAALSLACFVIVIVSGYRNFIFGFLILTMVGAWCYYSWRSLVLPAAILIGAFMLLAASSNNLVYLPTNKLPSIAQRSLSFLPGDWDEDAIESAKSSDDFRKHIENVYIKEYLRKSPFFGNGFAIDKKEFDALNAAMLRGEGSKDDGYLEAQTYITGKLFHTGWISVYDCVGIIGSIGFVALAWNVIRTAAHFIFGPKADRRSPLFPLYVWIMGSALPMMISYFTVYGDFKESFMDLCIYAMVLSQLSDIENSAEVPVPLSDHKGQVEFGRLSSAQYGYPSRP